MESYKKRHYEPVSLEIRLMNQADVITASSPAGFLTHDGVMDAKPSWVD